jgi:thermitase
VRQYVDGVRFRPAGVFGALCGITGVDEVHLAGRTARAPGYRILRPPSLVALTLLILLMSSQAYAQPRSSQAPAAPDRLLVTLRPGIGPSQEAALFGRLGVRLVTSVPAIRLRVLQVPAEQRETLRQTLVAAPEVATVDLDHLFTVTEVPNDPGFINQWGMSKVLAPQAWDVTHGSSSISIAIVDSGIATHPDLEGKVLVATDFTGSPNGSQDVFGHGTHVAGIAAADTNNFQGVAGLGYTTSLVNAKAVDDNGSGFESWVVNAITWSADQGARVKT